MKRGWITWDRTELPPSVFESRLAIVRKHLAAHDLPALVVYTDVWRSNQGRRFANFMPYWNRALFVVPRDAAPVLLCGLSPRVYPWIRSVSIVDEIRPSPDIAKQLTKMCAENDWNKVGVLDLPQLPYDLNVPGAVDVPAESVCPEPDAAEVAMYRHAAKLARRILAEELHGGVGLVDHDFVGRLELKYRRAGAEDLVVLVTNGVTPPLPPNGSTLAPWFSVSVAVEYRGHWAKIVRSFQPMPVHSAESKTELLSGPYPYECCQRSRLAPGSVFASVDEAALEGRRIFYGESYWLGPRGAELL